MSYPILFGNMASAGGFLNGSSPSTAAPSAKYLYQNGITTSGLYYIDLPSLGPTQVYCDMTNMGGGWMLAMKIDSTLGTGTVRHYFDPTWWNNQSGYGSAPSNPRTNGELKTAVYGYFPHTEMMLEYGYGSSYFQNIARARYTEPTDATPQKNKTMSEKMLSGAYHTGGGFTRNGFTTQQFRWTKQESTDNTFFVNAYAHINFGSHVFTGNSASNDFFRIWFNNVPDTSLDGPACNQIGGFGMMGDYAGPDDNNQPTHSASYSIGNASATISPPAGVNNAGGCQWNGLLAYAGSSGKNYCGCTTTEISSSYFNNGVGLIWVR